MIDKDILTAYLLASLEKEEESSDTARFIDDLLIQMEFGQFDAEFVEDDDDR